jgi:wobble nucleotide-excising tRNase
MDYEDAKLLAQQAYDSAKSAHKRLDTLEKEVGDIHELTASIKVVSEKVDDLTGDMNEIKTDVKKFSQRPGQMWDKLVAAMIGAAGSGLVGALLTLILK